MRITFRSFTLAAAVAAATTFTPIAAQQGPPPPGFGPGPGGMGGPGGPGGEIKLVARFDKNGDNRLNTEERKAARAGLAQNGGGRGFGRMGSGGELREPSAPGARLTPAEVKSYPASVPFYDSKALRTIFFQFETEDWEKELLAFNNTDVEVPATLTIDGKVYKDVGVHFRGASSFFAVPEGQKHSINVALDFVHDGQNVGGYRTLNLLNAHEDPTFLRTVLYLQAAREYLPAPKANFVRVVINGESWGVYPSAQQFNKDFVNEWFKTTDGARWKVPGSPNGRGGLEYLGENNLAQYKRIYEIKTKDDAKSWDALVRLTRVLNETPADTLEAALAPILDVDQTLKFLAIETTLVNNDGYWTRASDYSIYLDAKGRFHIMPHDANETFGPSGGRGMGPRGGGPGGRPGGAPGGMPGMPPPPGGGGRVGGWRARRHRESGRLPGGTARRGARRSSCRPRGGRARRGRGAPRRR